MKISLPAAALALAILLNGCAEAPTKSAAQKLAPQGLYFTYPTAQRNVIELSAAERNFMLNEMRYYLDMLWVASNALGHDDFDTVAKVARSRTPALSSTPRPATLEAKLPREYQALSLATYSMLDELAVTAEKSRNTRETLNKVAGLLQRCNECHAIFQFQPR